MFENWTPAGIYRSSEKQSAVATDRDPELTSAFDRLPVLPRGYHDDERASRQAATGEPERYVRYRQAAHDRLAKAKLAQQAYDLAVRSGERAPCADTRHALRMAILEAETSVLQAQLAR